MQNIAWLILRMLVKCLIILRTYAFPSGLFFLGLACGLFVASGITLPDPVDVELEKERCRTRYASGVEEMEEPLRARSEEFVEPFVAGWIEYLQSSTRRCLGKWGKWSLGAGIALLIISCHRKNKENNAGFVGPHVYKNLCE